MTEEKTAVDEEKKKQEEMELQEEITADDLAAGIFFVAFRKKEYFVVYNIVSE